MCRHHCNEAIGCSLYRINIDHKTSGVYYETLGKALIEKRRGKIHGQQLSNKHLDEIIAYLHYPAHSVFRQQHLLYTEILSAMDIGRPSGK